MGIVNKERYKGKVIKQVKGIVSIFDSFFETEKFDQIIEIGTGTGSFSIYFASKAHEMSASFITYDIKKIPKKIKTELESRNTKVVTCDINKNIKVEDIIKGCGRCLILNDGGLKVPQFRRFAKILKDGDVLMTHDYYKNRVNSAAGIIVMKDVTKMITKNKFRIIYEEQFDDFLWLCITR